MFLGKTGSQGVLHDMTLLILKADPAGILENSRVHYFTNRAACQMNRCRGREGKPSPL